MSKEKKKYYKYIDKMKELSNQLFEFENVSETPIYNIIVTNMELDKECTRLEEKENVMEKYIEELKLDLQYKYYLLDKCIQQISYMGSRLSLDNLDEEYKVKEWLYKEENKNDQLT